MSTLLSMTVQGGLLILATMLLRVLAQSRMPRRAFVALWLVAAVRLLVPVEVSSPVSVYRVVPVAVTVEAGAQTPSTAHAVLPLLKQHTRPQEGDQEKTELTRAEEAALTEAVEAAPEDPASLLREGVLLQQREDRVSGGRRPRPVTLLYLAGATLLSLYFLLAHLYHRRRLRAARPITSGPARAYLDAHGGQRVGLFAAHNLPSPLTYGLLRPRIILPASTLRVAENLPFILAHELTHIRRLDAPLKLLVAAALCAHWFNPCAWLLFILYNRDVELACDEQVLRHLDLAQKKTYAHLLLTMQVRSSLPSPLASGFSRHCIQERITAIMRYKKTSALSILLALVMVLTMTAAFATSPTPASLTEGGGPREGWKEEVPEHSEDVTDIPATSDWIHVLLLGMDNRDLSSQSRADALLIASVNGKTGQLKLTSVLRDMMVDIPGHGLRKIGDASYYGGPMLTMQLLSENLNIPLTQYAALNSDSLIRIVDVVGGVYVGITEAEMEQINASLGSIASLTMTREDYLAKREALQLTDFGANVRLNGLQAAAYTRIKSIDSDDQRTQRQRNVIAALVKRCQAASVVQLMQIATEVMGYLKTNVSITSAVGYVLSVLIVQGQKDAIVEWRVPSGDLSKYETRDGVKGFYDVDFEEQAERMNAFISMAG